ncbi:MAG: DUF4330 domain-containing protein [Oscillospiraceae bacterium]|nr:DUF4330 domain-containing protein [Oscillospiraceae bacterium]
MKEKNGRRFGKFNIVDLIIIIVIILVAIAVVFKLTGGNNLTATATRLTYTVRVDGVQPEVYEDLQKWVPGDKLMASGDILPAQVTAVTAVPHATTVTLSTVNGTVQLPIQDDLLDLTFTIEAEISNTVINELGTQEVRIGKTHIVKTQHFELANGIIQTCEWTQPGVE